MSPHTCPSCQSAKYTSLPFAYVMGRAWRANTYRCLSCGSFFRLQAQGVPAREDLTVSSNRTADRVL